MPSKSEIQQDILKSIDDAVDGFNKSIPDIEKDLTQRINNIIKGLDTSANGSIKTTISNLKKMQSIQREMERAFESNEYLKQVESFTASYNHVASLEKDYFVNVLKEFAEPSIMSEIKAQSVKTVTERLTGSNIVANVIEPINDLVRQGIESGVQWDELRASISDFLKGAEGTKGALDRYTTTITNDSLNVYSRTYENIIAEREGIEWYEYVGREVVDTRDFCIALDSARWFKKSDIPNLIDGQIKNYKTGNTKTVPLYKKTGKPNGMKAETNENNFVQLCGGWNCGHHAFPVPTELVPDEIK